MKALGVIPPPKFSQATILVGSLLAAWVLWLMANNRICTYWQILTGAGAAGGTSSGTSSSTTNPTGQQLYNVPSTFGNYIPYPFNQPAQ